MKIYTKKERLILGGKWHSNNMMAFISHLYINTKKEIN